MDEQQIGSYKILRKIGAGGMGRVYLAVHQDVPNLKVILKVLSDPSLVERFRQEADKLALLDGNPNICRIKHFFSQGEDTVIAMEYIDGVSLDDRIKTDGKINEAEALSIVSRVLDVLQFAHEKGVFHRDIKPSNIMIDTSGQVKVIDFGIAKSKNDPNLTMTGGSTGTPAYMAPEQFTPHADTDYGKVDIYAVGTTLYKMLTGELPFTAANEFALRDAKLFTDPPKPRSLNPEISKQVEAIILKAISKEHEDRYATAFEMKQAIDVVSGQTPKSGGVHKTAVQKQERTSAQMPPAGTRGKSKTPMLVGVAIVIIALAIGGYIMFKPSAAKIPPVLAPIGDQPITAGTSLMFGVTATDADNTTPVLSAKDLPPGANFTASTGVFEWTPKPDQVGSHTVVFFATHAKDNSLKDSQVVNIAVAAPAMAEKSTTTVAANPVDTVKPQKVVAQKQTETTTPETKQVVQPPVTPPKPPARGVGNVIVVSRPTIGADIYIDGKPQEDKTPYTFKNLSAGRHTIKATLVVDGAALERTQTVEVVADSTSRVNFDFDK